jgi:hypothetical protein
MIDTMKIFKRVIFAQDEHTRFLNATQKNTSYFYWGKDVNLVKKFTLPRVDMINTVSNFRPDPNNPLNAIVSAFTDEIAVSEFRTTVNPYPVSGKEPYESYADNLESYLIKLHKDCKRQNNIKGLTLELLSHGYFGVYFDGRKYFYLTAYDLIPGDKNVLDSELQPMWIRKTQVNRITLEKAGIDWRAETPVINEWHNASVVDELEMFPIFDVWVKDFDLNIGFTLSGKVVYEQSFPEPKRYPIFVGNTSEMLNSFYTMPVISPLVEKLKDYQEAFSSVQQSTASIAKPMLVYDTDSGINVDEVLAALKSGYKHVIVGKNRDGDINFKAPGSLPSYAQELPTKLEEDMLKALGLNRVFMGTGTSGARERGALSRLIKTSFRKLSTVSSIIEQVFTEVDRYAIDYLGAHCLTMGHETGLNIEELFNGGVRYLPEEKFIAYTSEDSYEDKMFVLNQWRNKMIPTEVALRKLGDAQPRKTMDKQRDELKEMQEFTVGMQKLAEVQTEETLFDKVARRLNGELNGKFWASPIGPDKMIVKIYIEDLKRAGFLLSDLTNYVLLEPYFDFVSAPPEQKEKVATSVNIDLSQSLSPEMTNEHGTPEVEEEGIEMGPQKVETRGRPNFNPELKKENYKQEIKKGAEKDPTKQEAAPNLSQFPTKNIAASTSTPDMTEETIKNRVNDKAVDKNFGQMEGFNPKELEMYLSKSQMIYNTDKYKELPGLYIVEPHSKWIASGRKLALILGKEQPEAIDKPMLLCGDKVYGVIILRKIIEDFDFAETEQYHLVTEKDRKKWWGDSPVYLYIYEFYPFKFPLDYKKRPGQLTFSGKVEFLEDTKRVMQDKEEEVEPSLEKPPAIVDNKDNSLMNV